MKSKICVLVLLTAMSSLGIAQDRPVVKFDASQINKLADQMDALKDWHDGGAFGDELASLPSPVGYMILRDNWNKGASIEARKQIFKGFVFNDHPDTLLVLNLGMRDPDPEMQAWANDYLKTAFLRDFSQDYQGYLRWFNDNKSLPYGAVKKSALPAALDRLLIVSPDEISHDIGVMEVATRSTTFAEYPKLKQVLDRAMAVQLDDSSAQVIARMLCSPSLTQADRDADIKKLLAAYDPNKSSGVLESLGRGHVPGLSAQLRPLATNLSKDGTGSDFALFDALADSGNAADLGFMVDLLRTANKAESRPIIMSLSRAIGISEDDHPDPAWWRDWWNNNRDRYKAPSDSELPSFKIDTVPTAEYIPDSDDVKDIPDQSYFLGGDQMKRYLVSGKIDPDKTQDLLIVMPGGTGDAEFHPFVKRIFKHELDGNWLLAQPIAPNWDDKDDRVVWPAINNPYDPAKFMMEGFIDGMIDEMGGKGHAKIGKIYMLAWSSSGPAVYSYLANGKHDIAGAFIAMSIFNRDLIKGTGVLHTKRIFLLHSPDDQVIPIQQAEAARDEFARRGIDAKLETYPGGHGWSGPVWQLIDEGFAFLRSS